ncbi:MAG: hypothetical protein K0S37_1989 [Microbacterium sp.]|jgi:hypothetical protein|nr:hypothetical protein [Microbacterium sp.]
MTRLRDMSLIQTFPALGVTMLLGFFAVVVAAVSVVYRWTRANPDPLHHEVDPENGLSEAETSSAIR